MPVRRLLRHLHDTSPAGILQALYAVMYLLAVPAAIVFIWISDLQGRHDIAHKNHQASVLIATSECDRDLLFKNAALKDAHSEAQIRRIEQFFSHFGAPIDHALRILGAPTCEERQKGGK